MKIKNKILCFIGWHSWTWTLRQENGVTERVDGTIPARAVCSHCGKKYVKD